MPLTYGDYSAWITVDGEEIPQYMVAEKKGEFIEKLNRRSTCVSCWIPSTPDKVT